MKYSPAIRFGKRTIKVYKTTFSTHAEALAEATKKRNLHIKIAKKRLAIVNRKMGMKIGPLDLKNYTAWRKDSMNMRIKNFKPIVKIRGTK